MHTLAFGLVRDRNGKRAKGNLATVSQQIDQSNELIALAALAYGYVELAITKTQKRELPNLANCSCLSQ